MGQDDTDWKRVAKEVPELRFLKTLVTGLTLVMGVGMVAVVALLWMRLNQPVLPDLPGSIVLPEGARPAAITFATDRIVVVTQTDQVLVYDRAGEPLGQLQLQP
ncbi:hypothetical protein E4L95_10350 [Paracoccus liaowanqingii]|uniref:Uncharacterized protein n=1 Tax=Paracoccus liaowanqingii TaxID=2560053 RepID=A0A4Z1CGD9_9RHOB|nr:DUF6476 family protein [Paracoccus liaowanqingii]TGN60957.1 hypothetical protein E4L95_10350 [Paracoccus liaowanqingii]